MTAEEQERGDTLAVLGEVIAKEAVGMALFLAVMWYFGPGKQQLRTLWARAQRMRNRGGDRAESEVAGLRRDVSRWEHEQASAPHHPSAPGGCGCG
jgi:hypothetical protein